MTPESLQVAERTQAFHDLPVHPLAPTGRGETSRSGAVGCDEARWVSGSVVRRDGFFGKPSWEVLGDRQLLEVGEQRHDVVDGEAVDPRPFANAGPAARNIPSGALLCP